MSVRQPSGLAFTQWATTLTAALLDRPLHHAHIVQISSESYRFKDRKQAARVKTAAAGLAGLSFTATGYTLRAEERRT